MLPDDVVFADIPRHALDIFLHAPGSAHKNGIVKTNIRSHIHSHSPVRTPKATEEQNPQLTKHDAFLCLSTSCPMWWWATTTKLGRCPSGMVHVGGLLT